MKFIEYPKLFQTNYCYTTYSLGDEPVGFDESVKKTIEQLDSINEVGVDYIRLLVTRLAKSSICKVEDQSIITLSMTCKVFRQPLNDELGLISFTVNVIKKDLGYEFLPGNPGHNLI
jgi:hypothetical protein